MERFWSKVQADADTGCMVWTGATNYGYGVYWLGKTNVRAHRWAWEQVHGPVPDGLVVDHLCRNRACVNVDHLEAVTPMVNAQRRSAAIRTGREGGCPHGHPASEMVLYVYESGTQRHCRICGLERAEAYRRAKGMKIKGRDRDTCMNGGHPWPENLRIRPGGQAYCAACHREYQRRYLAKRRAHQ